MSELDKMALAATVALDIENDRTVSESCASKVPNQIQKYRSSIEFIRRNSPCIACDIRIRRSQFVDAISRLI